MKVLLCGGSGVGKSSFVYRLTGNSTFCPGDASISIVAFDYSNGYKAFVNLWEIGAKMINSPQYTSENYFCEADAAILVIDAGSIDSLKDIDEWLCLLKADDKTRQIPKFLVVNKADCLAQVISAEKLDLFIISASVDDWFYTVGNTDLCDHDHTRGTLFRQSSPVDIVRKLITLVGKNRSDPDSISSGKSDALPSSQPGTRLISLFSINSLACSENDLSSEEFSSTCGIGVRQVFPKLLLSENVPRHPKKRSKSNLISEDRQDSFNNSWNSYVTSISREKAEELLLGFPVGTFLIRSSSFSVDLRFSIKAVGSTIIHTPFKWVKEQEKFRCGRAELRDAEFETFSCLTEALRLDLFRWLLLM
jgi:Ras of Complex, Roc, domain of DAPkinase/SH2 domain